MQRTQWKVGLLAALGIALTAGSAPAAEKKATLPMPEMVVTRTATPPKIDGKIEPGEWDRAAVCTAFVRAFEGSLARIQTTARITYDDRYFYVAFVNMRGEKLSFLQKRGRRVDDNAVVFDPSNEVWFSPPGKPATTYQTLFNAYPGVLDAKVIPSLGYTSMAWAGKWEIAAAESAESWTVEARAPISSFGFTKIDDGSTWQALFTADIFQDGEAFRAWAPGGGFSDIPRHGFLRFKNDSPIFQFLNIESIFTGKVDFPMAITAGSKPADATVTLRFGPEVAAGADDVVLHKQVNVPAGQRVEFNLATDLTQAKLPIKDVVIDAKAKPPVKKACPTGYCEIEVKTADGQVLYKQLFPFMIDGFVRKAPAQIVTNPYTDGFGVHAFYAPISKKLVIKVDRLYLDQRAKVAGGKVKLVEPATGKVVAERPMAEFREDYSEFPMDLSQLAVPMETEEDWAKGAPVREENKALAAENKKRVAAGEQPLPLKEAASVKPAEYTLEAELLAADGAVLAKSSTPVKLIGYQFEWENNQVGISDKVIPPWTPIQVNGGSLSLWNKTYQINGLGLAEKIVNAGQAQLAGPMQMIAVIDGRDVPVTATTLQIQRAAEAEVDLVGSAQAGPLKINTQTRVEFDGFVRNDMTLQATTARVDKLALLVTMPEAEAPCMVTTSGGWAAYHGWTPPRWDSRETSLGSMRGNFVPYVFFTDSERGFCWFADNEKGWILDPAQPTLEVNREGGQVTLRVNFINKSGTLDKPTTLRYGWMVSPTKPQPKGWRAYTITAGRPAPQATSIFWSDADWAVLWPYYCSPFPWHYDKSKEIIEKTLKRGTVPMVGNIAHAIGRYQDYKGRQFPALAADWGDTPGNPANGNVARSRGPNDFQVWHFDRWSKLSGLTALYFDENYLGEDWNYLTGGAYLLPDERVQPGYSYLGLREYDKRLRYMFHANGKPTPNLWLHTTSGQPIYAWLPDVSMEGENVEPPDRENDYIDYLPASRIRAIGMGRNLGTAPTVMCQVQRHWNPDSPFLMHQFVGWLLLHDTLPEGVEFWHTMMPELQMWREDYQFLPYWKSDQGLRAVPVEVNVSAHVRPGYAVLWVMNTSRKDVEATVRVDLKKLGFDPAKPVRAFDAETGAAYTLASGAVKLQVPARDWRAVRLAQPKLLTEGQTFRAHFDAEALADESLGNPNARARNDGWPAKAAAAGKTGQGITLDQPLSFDARMHVAGERGKVSMQLYFDPSMPNGTILTVGDLRVSIAKGEAIIQKSGDAKAKGGEDVARGNMNLPAGKAWHEVAIVWQGTDVAVSVAGQQCVAAKLAQAPAIPVQGRGLEINSNRPPKVVPPVISFGPIKGGVIDDLIMGQ